MLCRGCRPSGLFTKDEGGQSLLLLLSHVSIIGRRRALVGLLVVRSGVRSCSFEESSATLEAISDWSAWDGC